MKRIWILVLFPFYLLLGCAAGSKNSLDKLVEAQQALRLTDSLQLKQQNGIDLIGFGTIPVSWRIEIDFDESTHFYANNGISIDQLSSFEKKIIEKEKEIFQLKSNGKAVDIMVMHKTCESGSLQITVSHNDILYTGCANYLYNNKLNDVWELEKINNQLITAPNNSKKKAILAFNLKENTVHGEDGCNRLNGTIKIKGDRIVFSKFERKGNSCKENLIMKYYAQFIEGNTVSYSINRDQLTLYLSDDSNMTFKAATL